MARLEFLTVKDFLEYMGHRQMLCLHEPEQVQTDEECDDNNYDEDWLRLKVSVLEYVDCLPA